jgi:hypothetical protein
MGASKNSSRHVASESDLVAARIMADGAGE